MSLNLIAAVNLKNVIGKDNKLPWQLPEDMEYFRKLTTDNIVIIGRKTFQSLNKPLKNRLNIVVTKGNYHLNSNILIAHSVDDAINFANKRKQPDQEIFIIGGQSI